MPVITSMSSQVKDQQEAEKKKAASQEIQEQLKVLFLICFSAVACWAAILTDL